MLLGAKGIGEGGGGKEGGEGVFGSRGRRSKGGRRDAKHPPCGCYRASLVVHVLLGVNVGGSADGIVVLRLGIRRGGGRREGGKEHSNKPTLRLLSGHA